MKKEFFDLVKEKAEEFYKNIGKVKSPYFSEFINFNSKGLEHIKFKKWNKTRAVLDQYMRLKLIDLAPVVISRSHTLQGQSSTKEIERVKINKSWEKKLLNVSYFEFIAILSSVRIIVIIKQIGGGDKYFWSIIPFWCVNNRGEGLFTKGSPELD